MGADEKHAATYHGPVGDDTVRGRYCDGTHVQTGRTTDGEEYDAWLAQVRAEAKAEALEEAASEIYRLDGDDAEMYDEDLNATPVTAWLRDRANQYKEELPNGH